MEDDCYLPWACEECGYELKESPFITYECCPNCGSEEFYHGSLVTSMKIEDLAQDEDGEWR